MINNEHTCSYMIYTEIYNNQIILQAKNYNYFIKSCFFLNIYLFFKNKKGLRPSYQTYAFNMGCVTYFDTITHPYAVFTHP